MSIVISLVFIVGYILIAFEHKIKIDKAASALITGILCWLLYFLSHHSHAEAEGLLLENLGEIAAILFFLLGAMTIVEVIDSHDGFSIVTGIIRTRSKTRILLLVGLITFFLSAILDNLTTSIVMISLVKKLISEKKDRLWFAALIIISANAGGAWSPIGDVTTTMLWIGSQISAGRIVLTTFLPSLMVLALPLAVLLVKFKGQEIDYVDKVKSQHHAAESNLILFSGAGLLISVPVFKTLTHMPPFAGMLLALGIMWIISSLIHFSKHPDEKIKYSVTTALRRIDTSSILFFLGILLAVSALQSMGILQHIANFVTQYISNMYLTGTILGLFSAVIDNVPLVAAAQGMYSLDILPMDHPFWEFLALAAGTGGSAIIIGSAAGVAIMGIEKIEFFWYLRKISLLALIGFFAGLLTFILQQWLF
jgi:Na+/H+ antiporter NhaD/arsenite permease-like protein